LELPAEGDALTAVVYIDEGPPVVVEEVAVSLGGTALAPAERERLLGALPIARGAVFGEDAYERAVAYLRAYYRERGFARARVRKRARVDVRQGRARVAYEVASGPPSVFGAPRHEVRFGVGYDTEEQLRGLAGWRDYDFLGGARQLGFTARASFLRRSIAADFLQPHFPGAHQRVRLVASEDQEDEETYT